ncbi:MAG: GGDEF domain-containing protein [Campylobacterota bacterium]|nr:GGDEF domain-containing protein [Campylobacterota bacterium]
MNKNIKIITDKTVNKLLKEEIILPSTYFQTFNQYANELNINLNDKSFSDDINRVIQDDITKVNKFMEETLKGMEKLSEATSDAQQAIINKDDKMLGDISSQVDKMKNEITSLIGQLYHDSLTKINNKKWIYDKYLNSTENMQNDGILIYININDFKYINDNYGELVGDSALIYVSRFLSKKFKEEQIEYELVRYGGDQFIILIKDDLLNDIKSFVSNIRTQLLNSSLKTKSGHIFKITFSYGVLPFKTNDKFHSLLSDACVKIEEDRYRLKLTK